MDKQGTCVLAYIPVIGWIVAYCMGDREGAKFHLNQSLVLHIALFLTWIPILGWFWGIFLLVCWIMGLIGALQGTEKEVPLLGGIHILK